jgi:hypothetical protein
MVAEEDEPKGLREVKTVLRALQHIGNHPPQAGTTIKNPGNVVAAPLRAAIRPGGAESLTGKRPVHGKHLGALALAMLAAGTVIVLMSDLFLKYWPISPSSGPAAANGDGGTAAVVTVGHTGAENLAPALPSIQTSPPPPQAAPIKSRAPSPAVPPAPTDAGIVSAHELMDGGHIVAAREMLSRPDLAASQEGAWLLARSYDPSYLVTIQSPDASANPRQAEEWYRRWRDIAVRNGMAMDDLRLQRIIKSMQDFGNGDGSLSEDPAAPRRNR